MRLLTKSELKQLEVLRSNGVPFALLELTCTGWKKSIMDAVEEFRGSLRKQGLHDYETQPRGQDSKKTLNAYVITGDDTLVEADASLYRPRAKPNKGGDPRIWFSRLKHFVNPNEIIAVANRDGVLYVLNISALNLEELDRRGGVFSEFLAPFFNRKSSAVAELLGALGAIASRGFIRSELSADNTVGLLIERELGIKPNSNKAPDYKGIEIKGARGGKKNRHNLFSRVPDWALSDLKSSQEVLDTFGYLRNGRRQLYCTSGVGVRNSQGLALAIDEKARLLWETSDRKGLEKVLAWAISDLEDALITKHHETFWVTVMSRKDGSAEEFQLTSVEHTADPIVEQFTPLIDSRHITLDHEVRELNGRAAERGPAFKLKHGALDLLFPPSSIYSLAGPD